jgi:hypothetical protein
MPKYRIIETRPATAFWEYVVEADNEEQALEKVFAFEIAAEDHGFELNNDDNGEDDESTFEVFDAE